MLLKHSIIYVSARLVAGALSLLTTALLTWALSPAEYGVYGLALVIMSFASNIAFDWLALAFSRFGQAPLDRPKVVATVIRIFIALLAVTGAFALIGATLSAPSHFAGPVLLGALLAWAMAWFELAGRFTIMTFRPLRYLAMNLVRAVSVLAFAVSAAALTRDPLLTAAGTALGMILGSLLARFPGECAKLPGLDRALALQIVLFGWPFILSSTMETFTRSVPRLVVEALDSTAALGLYTAAYLIVHNTLSILSTGIASAGYTLALKELEGGDMIAVRRQLLSNGSLLVALMAPAALGLALTAEAMAATLVGTEFAPEIARLTPWMALAGFLGAIKANFLDHSFQLGRRMDLQIWVSGLSAPVSVGLSIYLVPITGPAGAAIAVAAGSATACVLALVLGNKVFPMPLPFRAIAKVAACCTVMAILVEIIPGRSPVTFAAQVIVGVLSYAVAAFALNLLEVRARVFAYMAAAHKLMRSSMR